MPSRRNASSVGFRQPLGQGREHARCGFDQRQLHVAVRIDAVEAVADQLARGAVQLGRQLDAGSTGTDDGDAQRPRLAGAGHGLRLQAVVEDALLQILGLALAVEEHAVLLHPRHAEIVADAAEGQHQHVVVDAPLRHRAVAVNARDGGQHQLVRRPIQPVHLALHEAEAMLAGMAEIEDRVLGRDQRAGGDLMQQRLPDMGEVDVDQDDLGQPGPTQAVAELRCQHEATSAATDDDDLLQRHLPSFRAASGRPYTSSGCGRSVLTGMNPAPRRSPCLPRLRSPCSCSSRDPAVLRRGEGFGDSSGGDGLRQGMAGLTCRQQHLDPVAHIVAVVVVRAAADQVAVDDAGLVDVDAAADFQVELAFGDGRHAAAADAVGAGRDLDAVADAGDRLALVEEVAA